MTVPGDIRQYLDDQGISYQIVSHQQVFSSGDEARAVGVVASHVAKTLVVKQRDGGDVLAVLPASEKIDMHKLRDAVGDNHARLATEEEMASEFGQYELGAVPPLGELLGATVFLDQRLENADEVIFAAGSHSDSIKMAGEDFLKLTHPRIVDMVRVEGEDRLY